MAPTQLVRIFAALVAAIILVLIVRHRRGEQEYPEIEYVLMIAFVVVAAVAIVPQVGAAITHVFDKINTVMMEAAR